MKQKIVKRLGLNKFISTSVNSNLIGLYDTSITTMNVGDEIINDSIYNELASIFPHEQFIKAPTHDGVSSIGIYRMNLARERFLCGSNIMTGKMFTSAQWNIGPLDILRMRNLTTVGVGWVDYQNSISKYTKIAYNALLSKEHLHSVRDEYTKSKFIDLGINNVINTACATMWKLTEEHCSQIPTEKASRVVFTLTDYRRSYERDEFMVNALVKNYRKVYLWLQGANDLEYFNQLNIDHSAICLIPPQLKAYDELLKQGNIDFVGTRLHAGIRSLQHKNRTIIIGVDNRAKEKEKDFNIKVIDRNEVSEKLVDVLHSKFDTNVNIPTQAINHWKEQFI